MTDYVPPDLTTIEPLPRQEEPLLRAVNAVEAVLAEYPPGRGSGKSTLRGFIADAILAGEHPLYKVVPVEPDDRS